MIERNLKPLLLQSAAKYPLVGIIGPRQSGKTTLARLAFPNYRYVNLEAPDTRLFAQEDPRGFLATHPGLTILDEIQRVPELFSYLQVHTDSVGMPGQYILTGSQNFLFMKSVSQSLAGRIALHTLLPFSFDELSTLLAGPPETFLPIVYSGGYPRVYDAGIAPSQWYSDYVQTYLDRDLRLLQNVADLPAFERFLRLCAGRTGQILNLTSLANDAGISHNTAKSWLGLLEVSFIVFALQPHHRNFNKRLIKAPKLYFTDTGLAGWLLNIHSAEQLSQHYLMGSLFETWVVGEYRKYCFNRGLHFNAFYWRDKTGHEIDLLIEKANSLFPVEIKSGATLNSDAFAGLAFFQELSEESQGAVVYGGTERQVRSRGEVFPWQELNELFARLKAGS